MNLIVQRDYFDKSEDFKRLVELQNTVYADRLFTEDLFVFWYKKNPYGDVISYNAYDGEKMVAHYACIPVMMNFNGEIIKGIHSMATVTHPDYRGLGLFTKLAQATYQAAKQEGFSFVMGVANANSTHGFVKKLGFKLISPLDVKFGVGKILKPKQNLFFREWTEEALIWRLAKNKRYYMKNGIIYKNDVRYPFFKLIMGLENKFQIFNTILSYEKRINKNFINLYIGLGADLSKGLYFNMPKFVKRSPFNLIYLDLTEGKLPIIEKNNIFFQLFDFDVA